MFFINDNTGQLRHGHKKSGAGADEQLNMPHGRQCPDAQTFGVGLGGMQCGDRCLAKAGLTACQQLWGKTDFRDENKHLPTGFQMGTDCFEVDFGFAASGNAIQQPARKALGSP